MHRLTPRREPRVLAVAARGRRRLDYAVVDLAEIRASGSETATRRNLLAAVARLVRRERPSAVAVASASLARRLALRSFRLPVVIVRRPLVDVTAVRALYPEACVFGPTEALSRAIRLAVTALLSATIPSRTYAPRTNRTARRAARAA